MKSFSNCKCRICKKIINKVFFDLGYTPLANNNLKNQKEKERYFQLKVFFCNNCKLAQLPNHHLHKEIFENYDYLSSYSKSWIKHSEKYFKKITKFSKLNNNSKICEIASNDGYLLEFFKKKKYKILGIEPAKNVAKLSKGKGIPTETLFFGYKTSKTIKKKYGEQDLIIANNVLAHVPDILDFAKGLRTLISKTGIITIEFPHIYNLIKQYQFDTIYHEHFSYLSIQAIKKHFSKFKLEIFKIEKIKTHGGSLRVYLKTVENKKLMKSKSLKYFFNLEKNTQIFSKKNFLKFEKKINKIKEKIIHLLIKFKLENKKVFAYGAAAKGNTFLNYCFINTSLIEYVIDRNPLKIGKFTPGSKIPIKNLDILKKEKPEYILILPWNLKDEIINQLKNLKIKSKFLIALPNIKLIK